MNEKSLPLYFDFFNEIGIIAQLSRALMEERLELGLLVSHFSVLNHLLRVGDGKTPLEIARAFQVPKTTMTHTLAGLTRHKLVAIRPNPNDGRSKCIWITEEGRKFRQRAIASMAPDIAKVLGDISADEIENVVTTLREIRKTMDDSRG